MEQLNIAGRTYGNLTALSYHDHKNKHPRWLFKCACGSILPIQKDQVVRGVTEQCTACGHLVTAAKRKTHVPGAVSYLSVTSWAVSFGPLSAVFYPVMLGLRWTGIAIRIL
jgi:hypothetical protein